jgi:hypothetical protein
MFLTFVLSIIDSRISYLGAALFLVLGVIKIGFFSTPRAGSPLLLRPVFVFMHFIAIMLVISELSPGSEFDQDSEAQFKKR